MALIPSQSELATEILRVDSLPDKYPITKSAGWSVLVDMARTVNDAPPPKYSMRVYFLRAGGHTHINIWTGPNKFTHGKAGYICMTNDEFDAWHDGSIGVEFFPVESVEGIEGRMKA